MGPPAAAPLAAARSSEPLATPFLPHFATRRYHPRSIPLLQTLPHALDTQRFTHATRSYNKSPVPGLAVAPQPSQRRLFPPRLCPCARCCPPRFVPPATADCPPQPKRPQCVRSVPLRVPHRHSSRAARRRAAHAESFWPPFQTNAAPPPLAALPARQTPARRRPPPLGADGPTHSYIVFLLHLRLLNVASVFVCVHSRVRHSFAPAEHMCAWQQGDVMNGRTCTAPQRPAYTHSTRCCAFPFTNTQCRANAKHFGAAPARAACYLKEATGGRRGAASPPPCF